MQLPFFMNLHPPFMLFMRKLFESMIADDARPARDEPRTYKLNQ